MPNLVMSASVYILLCSSTKVQEIMWLEIPINCKQAATAAGTRHLWFDETPWENSGSWITHSNVKYSHSGLLTGQILSFQPRCCLLPEVLLSAQRVLHKQILTRPMDGQISSVNGGAGYKTNYTVQRKTCNAKTFHVESAAFDYCYKQARTFDLQDLLRSFA